MAELVPGKVYDRGDVDPLPAGQTYHVVGRYDNAYLQMEDSGIVLRRERPYDPNDVQGSKDRNRLLMALNGTPYHEPGNDAFESYLAFLKRAGDELPNLPITADERLALSTLAAPIAPQAEEFHAAYTAKQLRELAANSVGLWALVSQTGPRSHGRYLDGEVAEIYGLTPGENPRDLTATAVLLGSGGVLGTVDRIHGLYTAQPPGTVVPIIRG